MAHAIHDWSSVPRAAQPPDFSNLLAVLERTTPSRPTLFEFFLNGPLYARLAGPVGDGVSDELASRVATIHGFRNAGYDYATIGIGGFTFESGEVRREATYSINEGGVITDRASFDAYEWPDPGAADYEELDRLAECVPEGMKLVVGGPCGVLENAIRVVGFETLCLLSVDDPTLVSDVFEAIGSRLVAYYERVVEYDTVGAIIGNDDWGFKSQTLLSTEDLRRLVFPWHKRLVAAAHAAGKPAILHSCGYLADVMDDVIDDMKYDGKHSYEDTIQPVEAAYDQYHERIAILGGIDVDFICRSSPEEVYARSAAVLERSAAAGSYGLGTGNSVPEYVPDEGYFAMIRALHDARA